MKDGSGGFSAARPAPPVAARTRPQTLLEICDIFGQLAGESHHCQSIFRRTQSAVGAGGVRATLSVYLADEP